MKRSPVPSLVIRSIQEREKKLVNANQDGPLGVYLQQAIEHQSQQTTLIPESTRRSCYTSNSPERKDHESRRVIIGYQKMFKKVITPQSTQGSFIDSNRQTRIKRVETEPLLSQDIGDTKCEKVAYHFEKQRTVETLLQHQKKQSKVEDEHNSADISTNELLQKASALDARKESLQQETMYRNFRVKGIPAKNQKYLHMRDQSFKIEKTPNLAKVGEKKKGMWILERDQIVWREIEQDLDLQQEGYKPEQINFKTKPVTKNLVMTKSQSGNNLNELMRTPQLDQLTATQQPNSGKQPSIYPEWRFSRTQRNLGLAKQIVKNNYDRIGEVVKAKNLVKRDQWIYALPTQECAYDKQALIEIVQTEKMRSAWEVQIFSELFSKLNKLQLEVVDRKMLRSTIKVLLKKLERVEPIPQQVDPSLFGELNLIQTVHGYEPGSPFLKRLQSAQHGFGELGHWIPMTKFKKLISLINESHDLDILQLLKISTLLAQQLLREVISESIGLINSSSSNKESMSKTRYILAEVPFKAVRGISEVEFRRSELPEKNTSDYRYERDILVSILLAKNKEIAAHRMKFKTLYQENKQSQEFISHLKSSYNEDFLTLEKKLHLSKWKEEGTKGHRRLSAPRSPKVPSDLASFIRFQHQRAQYYASKIQRFWRRKKHAATILMRNSRSIANHQFQQSRLKKIIRQRSGAYLLTHQRAKELLLLFENRETLVLRIQKTVRSFLARLHFNSRRVYMEVAKDSQQHLKRIRQQVGHILRWKATQRIEAAELISRAVVRKEENEFNEVIESHFGFCSPMYPAAFQTQFLKIKQLSLLGVWRGEIEQELEMRLMRKKVQLGEVMGAEKQRRRVQVLSGISSALF